MVLSCGLVLSGLFYRNLQLISAILSLTRAAPPTQSFTEKYFSYKLGEATENTRRLRVPMVEHIWATSTGMTQVS